MITIIIIIVMMIITTSMIPIHGCGCGAVRCLLLPVKVIPPSPPPPPPATNTQCNKSITILHVFQKSWSKAIKNTKNLQYEILDWKWHPTLPFKKIIQRFGPGSLPQGAHRAILKLILLKVLWTHHSIWISKYKSESLLVLIPADFFHFQCYSIKTIWF